MPWFRRKKVPLPKHARDESRLGQVLLALGFLTQPCLDSALELQTKSQQPLGELLVDRGDITPDELEYALRTEDKMRNGRETSANFAIIQARITQSRAQARTNTQRMRAMNLRLAQDSK